MVKLAKAASKQANQKKKAPPPPKEVDEESSEEDSEEEDTPPPKVVKKATPAKGAKVNAKNGKAAKKAESEDEEDDSESEEEAPPPKKTPAKAAAKPAPAAAEESDDDDDDDEESEDEPPPPKKAAKSAAKAPAKQVKAKPAKEPSDDEEEDDDDDDDESEEEAPPPKKAANQVAKSKAKKAKQEEEEEDDDDDDEEDESEEEMDTTPAPAVAKAKKAGMVKAKEESEEEDDDDEDDDDDDDEEEEEDDDEDDEEAPVTPAKRKADGKKDTPPAKKAKSEEGFCLFIGNLNSSKDFDEIKNAARKFFTKNDIEVADIRLGASKKFGYVEFSCEEDMQKALELNGKKLMGQEIKLDKARSKENSQDCKKERDSRTIFVKNLPFSATVDDLKEVFEDAVDVRLPVGQNGSNRGIAYIEFKTEAEAEKMLEEAQGSDIQGRSIMLDFVGEKSQKGAKVTAAASKTLVVNNLSFSATEEALQSTFEKAVSIRIPQRDGRPKGFAFLEFDSAEDAKEALDTLNNTEIEGRSIRLEFSQNSGGRPEGGRGNSGPTKTLFVKGLSEETTDQTLKDAFDGSVGARIVTDRDTGSSKGFGFVDFDNEDDCKAAKEAMEDGEIDGSKVTLDYAKPKGEGGFRGGRGGGGFGGFGGRGGGGFGGRGGGRGGGGFGAKPQGKKITFDD
ncbi:nucleolin isoform X1 [Hippocampus comes]|uniref:nucleolin isoform X1 n=1 Tax=Hippocampus comes TaxID=109280 RepID=UPI00094EEAB7|nr:PREDICTED: nucleolin isoform X1 [Hippocampus comes]